MAERTAVFNLKINDGNSAQKVAQNEKSLDKFRKTAQEAGKGSQDFGKKLSGINKIVDSNAFSFREANKLIQEYQTIAIQAGKDSPVGKEAISRAAQLTDQMGKLRAETNNLSNDGKNLQGAMQLSQGVLGGYQAFAGVTAMLGVENEQLMQTMVKLQAVQQVSMGLESARKSLEEGQAARLLLTNIRTKALAIGTGAYAMAQNLLNAAIGKGSIAMKTFRGALVSTGIGAIVVGIGMLIANFDKVIGVVQQARDWFNNLGDGFKTVISIILPFIGLIRLIGAGLEALGIIENDQDREREKQHQAQLARYKKDRDEIDKKLSKMRDEHKEFEDNGNFEIRMMKAQGASKEEIIKAEQNLRKETIRQNIALGQQLVAKNALLIAERDLLHARGEIKEGNELNDKVKENNKEIEALNKANRDFRKDIKVEDAKFKTEQENDEKKHHENLSKTRSDARKKDKDDEKKQEEARQAELQKIRDTATDLMINSIEDDEERKRMALSVAQARERQQLIEKFGEDTELLKELKEHQEQELLNLEDELDEKASEQQKLAEENQRNEELLRLENDLLQMELDFQTRLDREMELEIARRDALLENDELTAEERRRIEIESAAKMEEINQKKIDDEQNTSEAITAARQGLVDAAVSVLGELSQLANEGSAASKALAIGEIGAQTAMGFVRGLGLAQKAALESPPGAAPFVFPAFYASQIGSVLGAANKAKGILGAGGGVSAPQASAAPSVPSGGGETDNTRETREGESTQEGGKVFVTETDISRTQNRVDQINVRSSF